MIGGRVLDVSAVLDLATGTSVYGQALLTTATQHGIPLAVPVVALQAAWQSAPVEGRPWLDLLPSLATVVVVPLTELDARDAGILAADASRPATPLGTAQAVQIARGRSWSVVTADPDGVLQLDSSVAAETIP